MSALTQILKDQRGTATVAMPPVDAEPRISEREMVSTWVIATSGRDREGDEIDVRGCLPTIKNYAANAVVLFEHGRHDDAKLPIGTSIGGADGLPVVVGPDYIKAGCRHHDKTPLARDVWALTRAGILKAASIGFMPLRAERLIGDRSRFRHLAWDLTEWSICAVPVNSECVRRELSAGRIESPIMRKALAPLAQAPAIYAHGWNPAMERLSLALDTRGVALDVLKVQLDLAALTAQRAALRMSLRELAAAR